MERLILSQTKYYISTYAGIKKLITSCITDML